MLFFIVFTVVVLLTVGTFTGVSMVHNKRVAQGKAAPVPLSWPAKKILASYNSLPVENRPFNDITAMLIALDVKHGRDKATKHFFDGYSYRWYCDCKRYPALHLRDSGTRKCLFEEYRSVLETVTEVADAVTAQKYALEVAKVQPDLDDIKTLTERMRAEKEIITTVTKELL